MPNENKAGRKELHEKINVFLFCDGTPGTRQELVKMMAEISKHYQPYGKVSEIDFRELAPLFARLFAYDNKHYFVYKAISNPNKIGFLSKKQYVLYEHLRTLLDKRGISGSAFSDRMEDFLEQNGTMASPYKLLKRSFKENYENTKFLGRFFPLASDKKSTVHEDRLIVLCDTMMQLDTGIEIVDATVQECYDLDFHGSNIAGSSERCATNSCMHGKNVGHFYEAFGVHGKMVYYKGKPVGRFLMWDLPDGKKYIDRLYVRGEYMNEALAKIDELYKDSEYYKYPNLRSNGAPSYFIKLGHPENITGNASPQTPYIDTFGYLLKEKATGIYYLCNKGSYTDEEMRKYTYICGMRHVHNSSRMYGCPHCQEIYWTTDGSVSRRNLQPTIHKLYCKGYVPRTKELKDYLDIFRKHVPLMRGGENDTTAERNIVFEI